MKIDWRKHDKKAPDSIYVKLAKPGDVLRFSGFGNQSWQVQRVVPVTPERWEIKISNPDESGWVQVDSVAFKQCKPGSNYPECTRDRWQS